MFGNVFKVLLFISHSRLSELRFYLFSVDFYMFLSHEFLFYNVMSYESGTVPIKNFKRRNRIQSL